MGSIKIMLSNRSCVVFEALAMHVLSITTLTNSCAW